MFEHNLVQLTNAQGKTVAASVDGNTLHLLAEPLYAIALEAANQGLRLFEVAKKYATNETLDYDQAIREQRLCPPITHPDPMHLVLTGTGLTHMGSAAPRNKMHQQSNEAQPVHPATATDTQKMFQLGVDGGKPGNSEVGVQPEWFYKGSGHILKAPYQPIEMPEFALDGGEEAELAGVYIINNQGRVFRIGYTLGNEFADHVTEKQNYLYLAHSKLRECSIGPEIFVDELPEEVTGQVTLLRQGNTLWTHAFSSGEQHMCHSLANLEFHHFKYAQFTVPGQVHVHFLGAAILSFADQIQLADGDEMRIECDILSRPLSNVLKHTKARQATIERL